MGLINGAATAIITPFKNGEVNFKEFGRLIDWQIEEGIGGIVVLGTTGEAATMDEFERKEVMQYAIDRINKRVPAIIGVGSNDTKYCAKMSQYAESIGADALLIVTPYYNKTTQRGVVKHYEYIADKVETPIIIYNVPSRTGFHIGVEAVVELSKHRNIRAIKEASGDIGYVAKLASKVPKDFEIYSGNDDMVLPLMSLGGKGVISVVSNILPREVQSMVDNYLSGNLEEATKMQIELIGIISALFVETNPIPVKTSLNIMGWEAGELRLPLYEMGLSNKKILIEEMKKVVLKIHEN